MTKNTYRLLLAAGLASTAIGLVGCPSDPVPTDAPMTSDTPTTDTPPTDDAPTDAPVVITNDCAGYCTATLGACTGDLAQYTSMAECMAYCDGAGWAAGTPGMTMGNSIACRIYHASVAAMPDMGEVHCPHTGASGGGVCGTVAFSTGAGTRVDRMGLPALSTALIPSARKNAYNDASPADDAMVVGGLPMFAGDIVTSLTTLHTALDDDLTGAGLTPCSMTVVENGLPQCVGQFVVPAVRVVDVAIPDTLGVDPAVPSTGFPNGRRLADAPIDIVLSVILLDQGGTCGAGTCGLTTLMGTSALSNDAAFSTTFPYLADAHEVP